MFELKERTGDNLYCIQFPDGIVIPFRLLSNGEFSSCRTSLSLGVVPASEVYDSIFRNCVLNSGYTERPDDLRAGVPDLIAKVVYHMSGPNDMEFITGLLGVERDVAQSFESQMRSTICRTFSGYTMDKLDELSFPELIKLFAEAEAMLLQSGILEKPFEIYDKEQQSQDRGFSVNEAMKEADTLRRI